jgi:hypothetical protein
MTDIIKDRTYEISPAINGYILKHCFYWEDKEGMTHYKHEEIICFTWKELMEWLDENPIVKK